MDIYFFHIYLLSSPLQALGNLELVLVREKKYARQEAQYIMDHVTCHKICPFAMITQRKEIIFSWVGKRKQALVLKGLKLSAWYKVGIWYIFVEC